MLCVAINLIPSCTITLVKIPQATANAQKIGDTGRWARGDHSLLFAPGSLLCIDVALFEDLLLCRLHWACSSQQFQLLSSNLSSQSEY